MVKVSRERACEIICKDILRRTPVFHAFVSYDNHEISYWLSRDNKYGRYKTPMFRNGNDTLLLLEKIAFADDNVQRKFPNDLRKQLKLHKLDESLVVLTRLFTCSHLAEVIFKAICTTLDLEVNDG